MLTNNYEIYRYRDSYLNNVALHHHDFYEVYLFLNGNVNYTIESRNYHLLPGDILLISPLELHQPRITLEKHPYERIVLWVNKSFLEQFSTPHTTLTHCFSPICRIRSRKRVVFPHPGAPRIRMEPGASAARLAIPGKSLATRMHRELISRMPVTMPSLQTTSPHRPMRCPPGAVRYPCAVVAAAHGEYRLAALMQ